MTPPKSRPTPPPRPEGSDLLDCGRLIWPEELAEYCGVKEGTLDQWASRGGGPRFRRVGIHRRYHPADVRAWLDENSFTVTGERDEAA